MFAKLFEREDRKTGRKAAPLVSVTPSLVEIIRAFDGSPQSYAALYRELPPVRAVVDYLADAVASTSLKMYRRTPMGRPEERNHPMARLLRSPNPELTTRGLIAGTVRDIAVYGNAYWLKVEAAGGTRWLVPVPPWRVRPRGGDLLAPAKFDLWLGGPPVTRQRQDVVHFKFYDPEDRRIGSSKLQALRAILAEEIEAARHREGFWKNAARRDGVIERPFAENGVQIPAWSEDERKRFRESWQGRHSGSENAGVVPILEDGMHWVADSFSPKDSEFIAGREFILEATARVFNVPLAVLGLTKTATYASQREFHKALYQDTLPPWYELLQSEMELQLFPWFDEEPADTDLYVEFNVEAKLRGSFEEQAGILSTAIGRPWMTVKEGRDLSNLDDRGDPTDSELAVPTNNVSLGAPPELSAEERQRLAEVPQ